MADAKLERLLSLIAELRNAERPLTAQQLRQRVPGYVDDGDDDTGAFKRAFERDKAELRDIGVPLLVEPVLRDGDMVDGYRIDREAYLLNDPGLTDEERAALALAAQAVRLEGYSPTGGLQKLAGVGRASVPEQMALLPSAENLSELFQACTEARRVTLVHRDKARSVDPMRLHHDRHWYLQAFDRDVEAVRLFRLDRVSSVELDEPGTADSDIDPADHPIELAAWALGVGEPTMVTILAEPTVAPMVARSVGDGERTLHQDGSLTATIAVRRPDALRDFVLSFDGAVRITEPAAWHEDLVAWLTTVARGAH